MPAPLARASTRGGALSLLGLALLPRFALILAHPGVYGGDATARLARSDELVLAYQLPLPQLVVVLARALAPDPLWTRLAFAGIGALVAPLVARALAPELGARAAWFGGALAALHPLLLYYSLVPYQESLLLSLLLLAGAALRQRRDAAASLFLGLACLSRYEAWIAAALLVVARRRRPLRALVLFGWAPLLWVAAWGGLAPAGTYVLDLDPFSALSRLDSLWQKLREYSGWGAPLLALAGGVLARRRFGPALAWGAGYSVLVLAAIAVAGHEFPPGSGRLSERLAQLPALVVCALAGLALGTLAGSARRWAAPLAVALLLFQAQAWLRFSLGLVSAATREPSLRLAVEVARLAGRELRAGERLAVLGPPVPQAAIEDYIRKVERSGGDARRARSIATSLTRRSPDADRVAANLARSPDSVVGLAPGAALVAVFDDAPDRPLDAGVLLARFEAASRGVSVYRAGTR